MKEKGYRGAHILTSEEEGVAMQHKALRNEQKRQHTQDLYDLTRRKKGKFAREKRHRTCVKRGKTYKCNNEGGAKSRKTLKDESVKTTWGQEKRLKPVSKKGLTIFLKDEKSPGKTLNMPSKKIIPTEAETATLAGHRVKKKTRENPKKKKSKSYE